VAKPGIGAAAGKLRRTMNAFRQLALCLAVLFAAEVCAAQDAAGCKDSPLVSRFPGCTITACTDRDDDVHDFTMPSGPPKRIDGRYQMLNYRCPATASKAQVLRNLHTALQSAGYAFDYDSGGYGDFTVQLGKTWIGEEVSAGTTPSTSSSRRS
jgi:hypothetical protein